MAGLVIVVGVFLVLLAAAAVALVQWIGKPNEADRREKALDDLKKVHKRIQETRPDLIITPEAIRMQQMQDEVESATGSDPRKAAGNVQRLMESGRRR